MANKSFPNVVDELKTYREMRNPDKTPEPFTSDKEDPEYLVFVVQKHAATALHYDFRLQVGKSMPSWAVPKGPTLDNTVKRLAMRTEDHPLDYRFFEGVIPEGEYGAGAVMIWDQGYYLPEVEVAKGVREQIRDKEKGIEVMSKGLEKGEIKFQLFGTRLKGSFALVKTKGFPPGKSSKNAWLLIKHQDEFVQPKYDAKNHNYSVISQRSLEEIRGS